MMSLAAMRVPLGNLPIGLILIQDGTLAFEVLTPFVPFVDTTGPVYAFFDMQGFKFGSEDGNNFSYNTKYAYKGVADMLQWLRAQELEFE
jgi:hypothetical protein